MFKKGTRVHVRPTAESVRASYPAANWLTSPEVVTLAEDAPVAKTLDVVDVIRADGFEASVYAFNITRAATPTT